MNDRIRGQVFRVIDGETFMLKVTEQDPANQYGYAVVECIRLTSPINEAAGTAGKELARRQLEFEIGCQIIDCFICGCEQSALLATVAVIESARH